MAALKSQDPLDVLQLMVNDVLVQTGKALRASRKDAHGNTPSPAGAVKSKLPDTINTFHAALNELEWDIIHAKSVLMRDLKRVREQNQHSEQSSEAQTPSNLEVSEPVQLSQPSRSPRPSQSSQSSQPPQPAQVVQVAQPTQPSPLPQPIESQSKSPMVIDLDSSPPPNDQPMIESKANKPVAPFPDMGMGLADVHETDVPVKEEPTLIPQTTLPDGNNIKSTASPAPMAPMPNMDQKPTNTNVMGFTGSAGGAQPELNFTNMEFTLVPPNNDSQNPSTTLEPSFDLASFAPSEGNNNLLSLDNLLPIQPSGQPDITPAPHVASRAGQTKMDVDSQDNQMDFQGMKEEVVESTFDDMFYPGNDDEFGGDGMNDATFDELMKDDVDDFNSMEHGEFDANYFGLDQTD